MLIEFSVTNFRSFKTKQTLSMVAAAAIRDHQDSHTFESGLTGIGRILKSAVIYGANAAGKTNVLLALQFMQIMVVNSATTAPGAKISRSPFKLSRPTLAEPSVFEVTFSQNDKRYEYGFSVDSASVREEWLIEYANARGRNIFTRSHVSGKRGPRWKFSSFLKGQRSVWAESTRPNVLFLSMATSLNSTQLLPIFEWFQKKLAVIVKPTVMNTSLTLQLLATPEGKQEVLPFLQEADLGISDVVVEREPIPATGGFFGRDAIIEQVQGSAGHNLIKITFGHLDGKSKRVPFDWSEESAGTQHLFTTAGAWLNVLKHGETLLIDEIETSLHPKLLYFLLRKFHSKITNPKSAQLLFTTHNTSLLDLSIFRRDQIWFVEKKAGVSSLFPLTDFKPRNDAAIEKKYMHGSYGAIPILPPSES